MYPMNKAIQFGRCAAAIMFMVAWVLPCTATDTAVLRNGFSIRHERRQVIGTVTRLFVDGNEASFVDISTAEIDHYESLPQEPILAPALPTPKKELTPHAPDLNEVIKAASGTYKLDPDLVNSVIRAESGFNVRAVSPKGAQGLMQLMPQTASELGVQNSFDARANVEGGTRYLRELLERYNFDLIKALAAYNAGPERVEHYGGVPPYYETKAYVSRIVRDFNKKKLAAQATAKNSAKKQSQSAARKNAMGKSSGARTAKLHEPTQKAEVSKE
jgi:Transglycosylase SLT domain